MVFSVLQRPVWLIWNCPKNYLSVRMSQGNFGHFESSRSLFHLIQNCQLYILIGPIESSRKWSSLTMIRNFQWCFVFIPKFSGDTFCSNIIPNILVKKCEEHKFRKSQVTNQKNSEYLRRLEQLSRSFQPLLELYIDISRQYLLPQTVILQKKVIGCP